MSVQTELDRLNAAKNSLKTAIEGKGVTVSDSTKLDGYGDLVEQIESIADVPVYNGEIEDNVPDDGKTRLYITVPANTIPDRPPPRNQVPLRIKQTITNGVTIDWGDGTAPETLSGTGAVNTTHAYEKPGDYVISLYPIEGCSLELGSGSTYQNVMGSSDDIVYCNMLKKAIVGKNVKIIGKNAFYYCHSLSSLVIPEGVTSFGDSSFSNCYSLTNLTIPNSLTNFGSSTLEYCYSLASLTIPKNIKTIPQRAFYYCYSLEYVAIPDSVTSIGNYAFQYCYSLTNITIPDNVTSIGSVAFGYCKSLASLTVPEKVTSIGTNAFYGCKGIKEYHFLSKTPPVLVGSNIFYDIKDDCIIYVPKGSAEAYKTATNWTTVADHIQEEPA